jgi:putative polyhydroxyalkanoate system protein
MASISIQRSHQLSLSEAKERVTQLAESLEKDLDARWRWQGDELRFERTGASGVVRVASAQVDVEVQLGLLLRPLKATITARIHERLDSLLGPVA